jgi:hypothetical protein
MDCEIDERVRVFVVRLADGVREISQKSEVEIGVPIRQIADFELIHKFADLLLV